MAPTYKTPGVYIEEVSAFGKSVNPVPTAIPAFIGYTPKAEKDGISYTNVPKKISSFLEFLDIFGFEQPDPPADQVKNYSPQYYLIEQSSQPSQGDNVLVDGKFYSVLPDASTVYYFYNSIKLFFNNGGNDAYIVSVGSYGEASGVPVALGEHIKNPNIKLNDLLLGLDKLKDEIEPTMYVCPDATLLNIANNATLMQMMLQQCDQLGTAISIFDLIGSDHPDPLTYENDILTFRTSTGTRGLKYGAAYFPFLGTTIMQEGDLDYTNLFNSDLPPLIEILNPDSTTNPTLTSILNTIENPTPPKRSLADNHGDLMMQSSDYVMIIKKILEVANILPPSSGMAGLMTKVDDQRGVWKAPANVSLVGVTKLPIEITHAQHGSLNVDAVSGKSINVIRKFPGVGIVVWGARTLDGNSTEWRYINVRRTFIFIEGSCKKATEHFVFEPNDANTWAKVKAMLSNFLTGLWRQGALQGAKPEDAFFVNVGLGQTMTAVDILEGRLIVEIGLAVVRPAEFIILRFQHKMRES